ncbi:MAG TPA: LAGLIDADG family homing endonuclease [Candidatus Nanoarchaeia archaeon]|nr:LAGLIDADG family homing endonuclease [Candidatus Nanoarchaeia archaeon]
METNIRKNHELRLRAFDLLQEFKNQNVARKEAIDKIHAKFGVPKGAIYSWYSGDYKPFGRREEILYIPELFYVLGALLGDGCVYNYKTTRNYTILVGDDKFTAKYAKLLSKCVGKEVRPYINRSKNIWFVSHNNFKLYSLFKKVRTDLFYLELLMHQNEPKSFLLFIEGFFDAEGCVKIIKEDVRKTPKICLDITNTNFLLLELVRKLLQERLGIEARYSIQKADSAKNKQVAYHLRIYKKEFVRRFFEYISTTKLKEEKAIYLENWLNNGK